MHSNPRFAPHTLSTNSSFASTQTSNTRGSVFEQMYADPACDTPPSYARTTNFIGHFWPEQQTILPPPTTTTMPRSYSRDEDHLDKTYKADVPSNSGSMSNTTSPSSGTAITAVEDVAYDPYIDSKYKLNVQNQENVGSTETSLPLTPYPGSIPQLSGALTGSYGTGHAASNFVRTALMLLTQNNTSQNSTSSIMPNPLASTLARDSLLVYAHRIFNSSTVPGAVALPSQEAMNVSSADHPYHSQLLPLLQKLRTLHPRHLPTLLLLGCVHYAIGDFNESLALNEEMLQIDPNFVEAMSNLGTTLKAMGRSEDAIHWWWKAVSLRPNYWDAVNNLLGALVAEEQERIARTSDRTYVETLRLCETVQSRLIDREGRLLVNVPPHDLHHLQNLFYVSGNIRCLTGEAPNYDGLRDFISAIETLLHVKGPGPATHYNFRHLLLAVCVGGLKMSSSLPEPIVQLALSMGYPNLSQNSEASSCNILEFVRNADDKLWQLILAEGEGMFPPIFVSPEQATDMSDAIFQGSLGVFPSFCSWSEAGECLEKPAEGGASKASEMASNVLLSIAKIVQETKSTAVYLPRFENRVHVGPSLVLLLYYLAFVVFRSPSSCNNLGIILSTTPWVDVPSSKAVDLARAFYQKGLELDRSHAHLLTNMGSLLKEAGELDAAIEMYTRAVQANPMFDVALANLANAVKDSGGLSESIAIYRRAIEINDDIPEALCGLAHAAWSICDWRGFGRFDADVAIDSDGNALHALLGTRESVESAVESGWMPKLIQTTQKQLAAAYQQNVDVVKTTGSLDNWIAWIEESVNAKLLPGQRARWVSILEPFFGNSQGDREGINEGSFMIRIVEWLTRHLQWRWYIDAFGHTAFTRRRVAALGAEAIREAAGTYSRPNLPPSMSLQMAPSVLPFHTFIYPLSAREIRLVAHRNALRVSHSTLTRSWLPEHVYPPPPPPGRKINVGYMSSDFIDHPTAHLISSVFGMHDRTQFRVFAYALTESDGSSYRAKIEGEVETFRDVSAWSTQAIVELVVRDEIHILVNLNGYTKGARNDIFAARPCPIQISFLGFAGTLASGWCDYIVCDPIACPPSTRTCELCDKEDSMPQISHGSISEVSETFDFDLGPDPDSMAEWKYIERLIYMPHTYLVTDHKQCYGTGSREPNGFASDPHEQWRIAEGKRRRLRHKLFPDIFDDTIIFANFNQMYKLDPSTYAAWLRIMKRVPNSILWLLRFPPAGEEHLLRTARQWAGPEIASRVRFTDVVTKDSHIDRVGVADIFLDTVECNAHTVAADVLWGGTPIITWPKYTFKMCSRVGASIAFATGYGHQMVVGSLAAYEERAVSLALSVTPTSFGRGGGRTKQGELADLRRNLFMDRETMPLFDCRRWTRNLEKGYIEAWKKWVRGGTTTHFHVEGGSKHRYERCNGFIWIRDEDT